MSFVAHLHVEPSAYRRFNRRTLVGIQKRVAKQGNRSTLVRFILAKGDKDKIAGWKQDLVRVLQVFNVRNVRSVSSLGHSGT